MGSLAFWLTRAVEWGVCFESAVGAGDAAGDAAGGLRGDAAGEGNEGGFLRVIYTLLDSVPQHNPGDIVPPTNKHNGIDMR